MRSPPGVNMLGEELSAWNTVFEQRVAERTEEVTATSHRLEAEVTERRRAHARPTEANAELTALVDELRRLNDQIGQLAAMSNLLQSATDRAAACEVIARLAPTLFDGTSGAVYVLLDLGEQARAVGTWGTPGRYAGSIHADDCVALRHGRTRIGGGERGTSCAHLPTGRLERTMCIPLVSHTEVLGLLTLDVEVTSSEEDGDDPGSAAARTHEYERLASAASEQFTLSVTNLELRNELHRQAIRDALTGLYNRRHLDETLANELHRARRSELDVSVLMVDIDHFKAFNDTYGHAAGDAVLADVASILQASTRAEDVACRYGGEEFAIIMSGLDLDRARRRGEQLRAAVAEHAFRWDGGPLGHLTISVGIATFPTTATIPTTSCVRPTTPSTGRRPVAGTGSWPPADAPAGSEADPRRGRPAATVTTCDLISARLAPQIPQERRTGQPSPCPRRHRDAPQRAAWWRHVHGRPPGRHLDLYLRVRNDPLGELRDAGTTTCRGLERAAGSG